MPIPKPIDITDGWYKMLGKYRLMPTKDKKPRFWWVRFAAGMPVQMVGLVLDSEDATVSLNSDNDPINEEWTTICLDLFRDQAKPKKPPTPKPKCRYGGISTGASVPVLVQKKAPMTGYAVRMEQRIVDEALEKVRGMIQRTTNNWPTCLVGEVHLKPRLDRENQLVNGEWYCSCGG